MKHTSTLPVAALREFLRVAAPVFSRTKLSWLRCVQIGDRRIAATNLDFFVSLDCPEANGPVVAVEEATLTTAVRFIARDAQTAVLLVDDAQVSLGGTPLKLERHPVPVPEIGMHSDWQQLDALAVFQLAAAQRHASTDNTRYVLNSVYFDAADGRMVGTDGRRLYRSRKFHWRHLKQSFILPTSRLWVTLARHAPWHLRLDSGKQPVVQIRAGGFSVVSKTLDATYPRYTQVIPRTKDASSFITLPDDFKAKLSEALGEFPVGSAVRFSITPDKSEMACGVTAKDFADNPKVVPFVPLALKGPGGMIGLNTRFLLDAMSTGNCTLGLRDHLSPAVVIDPFDPDGELSVVMPVRVA